MMKIIEAIDALPEEFQLPIIKAFEYFRLEIADTVKRSDFDELKATVKELAEAQKKSEERAGRLETAVTELIEAQRRTEKRLEELVEAQKKSEERTGRLETAVTELIEAQKRTEEELRKLAKGLANTRRDLGGLQRTMSYAFENEAFRLLPAFLKSNFQIEIKERFVRQEIGGKEINIFAHGKRNGKDILIMGESKLRLTGKRELDKTFSEIEEKVEAIKNEYGDVEIVKILITHYATQGVLKKAKEIGILVIQSFEL
ncbi:MAG: hypothetical protein N2260_00075 [Syntrophobacterales bacterium]|nr:hypothetical protein [Syntrophobacterales bacterium]